jgi:hypothetical protein
MPDGSRGFGRDIEDGCSFLIGDGASAWACGVPRQSGSSFCSEHHALCHISPGSGRERQQIHEIEALANAVGGRRGHEAQQPPPRVFNRLLRVERRFLRPYRS